jgi:hypothetical protein
MDVDEPEDGTQQPLKPRDYGLVIDFSDLAEEDKEVRAWPAMSGSSLF